MAQKQIVPLLGNSIKIIPKNRQIAENDDQASNLHCNTVGVRVTPSSYQFLFWAQVWQRTCAGATSLPDGTRDTACKKAYIYLTAMSLQQLLHSVS